MQWNLLKRGKIPDIPSERVRNPEDDANFLSRLSFSWLNPLMKSGYKRPLELQDIWLVPADKAVDGLQTTLRRSFEAQVAAQSRYPLTWALYQTFRKDFILSGIYCLVQSLLLVTAPFTLRYLIAFSKTAYTATQEGRDGPPIAIGMAYVIGISAMQIILSFGLSHFTYRSMLIGGESRSALIALLLEKSLKMSRRAKAGSEPEETVSIKVVAADGSTVSIPCRTDPEGWSNGRIMNLISTDTSRIQQACDIFHLAWTSPVQVILTVALLIVNLGYSSLAGVAVLFVGLAALTSAMKVFMSKRAAINDKTDKRVSLTQELLSGIIFIKFFALEGFFLSRLKPLRAQETKALRSMHITKSAIEAGSLALPIFSNMLAFVVYSVTSHALDPATVFSSLALFNGLRTPMNWLPVAIGYIADAYTSIKRIEDFLLAEEVALQADAEPDLNHAMELRNATFTWERVNESGEVSRSDKKSTENDSDNEKLPQQQVTTKSLYESSSDVDEKPNDVKSVFRLRHVSLNIERGELLAIVGSVGCGKSSLLSALASEMRQCGGTLSFCDNRAYCPQYAWIQNATIRDNIIFGQEYDAARYAEVVRACCLLPDFDSLSSGDATEIGEKGITLSGGQKQRINIARAIYSNTGIVILDDPLSAVDAHVGKRIFNDAICGLLKSKCVVMATHQLHLLSRCDRVVWMVDGRLEATGTYQELMSAHSGFVDYMAAAGSQLTEEEEEDIEKTDSDKQAAAEHQGIANLERKSDQKGLMQEDVKIVDSVPWSVYGAWIRASGGPLGGFFNVIIICLIHSLFRASNMLTSLSISWWVSDLYRLTRGQYIALYTCLAVTQGVLFFIFAMLACVMGTRASQTMSNTAMWRILRAPMAFFNTTPHGRIIHRFTKDVDTMDNQLTDSVRQYIVVLSSLVSTFVLIIVYFPYFAVALFFSGFCLLFCVAYYRSSARELKRHHAILDGAVFARFSETLSGSSCIKAYAREEQFQHVLHRTIDDMGGAYFLTFANQQWLALRLDNIGNLLVFVTGLLVVTGRFSVDPSIGGLILSYSLSIVGIIQLGIRYLVLVDNSMTSTERLHQYATTTAQEAAAESEPGLVRPTWPEHGAITYENVQMRYRPELPLVVDGFNLDIKAGERLGIVGRTGAGKSTILSTLFRLTELSGGRILIDGVDIKQLGLHDLRSRISIIPQDPTLFRGTVRSNIDPMGKHADLELWNVLRQVQLNIGLDDAVDEEGYNFSLGQRQLLALARVILRDERILLVDEGTSSVSPETDALVQQTLAHDLGGKTLIAIAHRLRTVLLYDRICVMDKGEIAELGTPLELWEKEGIFRGMCESSKITRDMFFSDTEK